MSAEDRLEDLTERYPHIKSYQACQSAAFAMGSLTLAATTAASYFGFDFAYRKFKPNVSKNWVIALPILTGIVTSYVATMRRTSVCQNMWMAMEERHSILTPAEERLSERLKKSEQEKDLSSL